MNTEKLNQAINNGKSTETRQQQATTEPQQTTSNQSSPFNVIDGVAKLVAPKLQEAFNNAVIGELCSGFQKHIEDQVINAKPVEQSNESNPVIEVFTSSQVQSYGTTNVRVFSSSSVSTSLPPTSISNGQTINGNNIGNGKGFDPKN